jgi:hypothetical protein
LTDWRNITSKGRASMTVKRMDNVGIVVESLDTAISFLAELGLELEGRAIAPPISLDRHLD